MMPYPKFRIPLLAALGCLFAVGCRQSPALHQPSGPAVATINQDRLTKPEVDYLAEQLQGVVTPENLPKVIEHMVTVSLLAQEALRRGLLKDPEVQARLAWIERMYLTSELTERLTTGIEPSSAELLDYYQAHKEEFCVGLKLMLMVLPDTGRAQSRGQLCDLGSRTVPRHHNASCSRLSHARYW